MIKSIPKGYRAVNMSFTFKDSRKAMAFYKKAFRAKELSMMSWPNGQAVMHGTMKIGNSIIMFADEMPGMACKSAETMNGSPISLYLYVKDADKMFNKAVKAGASVVMPLADMFWGDRTGQVRDPFGYNWMIATHIKDVTDEEVRAGSEAFVKSMK